MKAIGYECPVCASGVVRVITVIEGHVSLECRATFDPTVKRGYRTPALSEADLTICGWTWIEGGVCTECGKEALYVSPQTGVLTCGQCFHAFYDNNDGDPGYVA